MSFTLTFDELHEYDAGDSGISVPVRLGHGDRVAEIPAKLDTGASYCIFRRRYGEMLGLAVESGYPQHISTATGSFLTYGHEVTLRALGMELSMTAFFAADDMFTRDVLGRQGFLQQLKLGLVAYEGKLYLSRYHDTM